MEILTGVIISFSLSTLKWLSEKIGKQMTRSLVVALLFIVVFIVTFLKETGRLPMDFIVQMYQILGIAVINYEIIIKRFIRPLLEEGGLLKTK